MEKNATARTILARLNRRERTDYRAMRAAVAAEMAGGRETSDKPVETWSTIRDVTRASRVALRESAHPALDVDGIMAAIGSRRAAHERALTIPGGERAVS